MAECLPMYLLQETIRSWPGGDTTTRPFLTLSPEAEDKFSELLEAFGVDSWLYLSGQERSLRASNWWPWAMVALPEEYRIAGHLFSIRRDPKEFKFTNYSTGPHSLAEQGPPLVSIILFRDKAAVMRAAAASEALKPIGEVLKDKPEQERWFVLADPLDPDWVRRNDPIDDEVFFAHYNP